MGRNARKWRARTTFRGSSDRANEDVDRRWRITVAAQCQYDIPSNCRRLRCTALARSHTASSADGCTRRGHRIGKLWSCFVQRSSKISERSTFALDPSRSRHPAISLQSAEVVIPKSDSKSIAYENRTKSAKCGGLETNGPRERISDPNGCAAVRRFRAKDRRYWRFQRSRTWRRMLVAEGLAEGEEL